MKYWEFKDHKDLLDSNYVFVVGMRGDGKSYTTKQYLYRKFKNEGKQFIVLRRFITEKMDMDTYFDDLKLDKGDEIEFKGGPEGCYYLNGEPMGWSRCISQYKRIKSSVWKDVDTIVYEEFLRIDGCRDEEEVVQFRNIISSVFRQRTGHVFLIGNLESRDQLYTSSVISQFGFDFNELKQGGTIYSHYDFHKKKSQRAHLNKSICLHWCENAYGSDDEVPIMMRIPNNSIATDGSLADLQGDVYPLEEILCDQDDDPELITVGLLPSEIQGFYLIQVVPRQLTSTILPVMTNLYHFKPIEQKQLDFPTWYRLSGNEPKGSNLQYVILQSWRTLRQLIEQGQMWFSDGASKGTANWFYQLQEADLYQLINREQVSFEPPKSALFDFWGFYNSDREEEEPEEIETKEVRPLTRARELVRSIKTDRDRRNYEDAAAFRRAYPNSKLPADLRPVIDEEILEAWIIVNSKS